MFCTSEPNNDKTETERTNKWKAMKIIQGNEDEETELT